MDRRLTMITTSVIVPVRNNVGTLAELVERTVDAMSGASQDFEIILVDDASDDRSWELIVELASADPRIHGLRFHDNQGQVPAIAAGVLASVGAQIAYLDADLEYSPDDLPRLLERLADGADMVSGVRPTTSGRPLIRRLLSAVFNLLGPRRVTSRITDPGSGIKAWKRAVWMAALRRPSLCRDFTVLAVMSDHADRIDNVAVSASRPGRRSSYHLIDLVGVGLAVAFLTSSRMLAWLAVAGASVMVVALVPVIALAVDDRPLAAATTAVALLGLGLVLIALGGVGIAVLRVAEGSGAPSTADEVTEVLG